MSNIEKAAAVTIEMASKAGFKIIISGIWEIYCTDYDGVCTKELKAFEAFVRADEREACAKVAESCFEGVNSEGILIFGQASATAIQARGQA
jgi:hypothetical protein